MAELYHYTTRDGGKAIASQTEWTFKACQPPADHPFGAYFTPLGPREPKLAQRLRIPRRKLEYLFKFVDVGDLLPLRGGRGTYSLYSPSDYHVSMERQIFHGELSASEG